MILETTWKRTQKSITEIGPSDGGVGAQGKPSAFQKFFMAEKLY